MERFVIFAVLAVVVAWGTAVRAADPSGRWSATFMSQVGEQVYTYEFVVKGTTLTTKPLVAKNEGVMQGAGQTREFKIEGNTLWLIAKPAAGQQGAETRTKLTRLE